MISIFKMTQPNPLTLQLMKIIILLNITNIIFLGSFVLIYSVMRTANVSDFIDYVISNETAMWFIFWSALPVALLIKSPTVRPIAIIIASLISVIFISLSMYCIIFFFMK